MKIWIAIAVWVFISTTWAYGEKRIVSISPVASEIISFFGESDQLVGIDSRSEYLGFVHDVKIIGSAANPNLKKIMDVNPDIVIGVGEKKRALVYRLRNNGVQTLMFPYPDTLSDLYELMILIGQLLGKQEMARLAVKDLKFQVIQLKKSQPLIKPRVMVVVDYPPIIAASHRTFINQIIELAGGKNMLNPTSEFYTKVRVDYLMRKNPEIVLVTNPRITDRLVKGSPVGVTNAGKRQFVLDKFDYKSMLIPSPRFTDLVQQLQTYFHSYVDRYY